MVSYICWRKESRDVCCVRVDKNVLMIQEGKCTLVSPIPLEEIVIATGLYPCSIHVPMTVSVRVHTHLIPHSIVLFHSITPFSSITIFIMTQLVACYPNVKSLLPLARPAKF